MAVSEPERQQIRKRITHLTLLTGMLAGSVFTLCLLALGNQVVTWVSGRPLLADHLDGALLPLILVLLGMVGVIFRKQWTLLKTLTALSQTDHQFERAQKLLSLLVLTMGLWMLINWLLSLFFFAPVVWLVTTPCLVVLIWYLDRRTT